MKPIHNTRVIGRNKPLAVPDWRKQLPVNCRKPYSVVVDIEENPGIDQKFFLSEIGEEKNEYMETLHGLSSMYVFHQEFDPKGHCCMHHDYHDKFKLGVVNQKQLWSQQDLSNKR